LHDEPKQRVASTLIPQQVRQSQVSPTLDFALILEGKIKNGKSGYFTTDYTDFDGFHGEDHCFLTNYPLTQRISDSIFITL
jgi:hypothetical protein